MRTSDFNKPTPAYHHLKHPGGRLTKIGGQAVSLAPQLGQAFASLGASVSRIAVKRGAIMGHRSGCVSQL
ncbi:hypothetical protein [Falsihalocynthiibacter arcticus]|uniref:Uncharacterized protein n=1 Tax=Falsihalocynthiibacter arcticus TaxID=1579316 RepID=A0A126UZZ1_9RHOB|nr:hypothetical protein [Falsihalocynthiibacter arcticus]AML51623.1 hypothetical protein RC74_10435 [Falsihalocynthiibacter arcticus]